MLGGAAEKSFPFQEIYDAMRINEQKKKG